VVVRYSVNRWFIALPVLLMLAGISVRLSNTSPNTLVQTLAPVRRPRCDAVKRLLRRRTAEREAPLHEAIAQHLLHRERRPTLLLQVRTT
jgi:hypothetical protein